MKQTYCERCGKPIQYKTKPPKLCQACRSLVRKKPSPKLSDNSQETLMCYLLERMFPQHEYIRNGYFSFLRSPKGQPMQLDIIFPKLKLAFEYQGSQHTKFNPFFHKSQKAFEYLRQCDNIKKELCRARGITLIEVKHTEPLTQESLREKIIRAGRKDVFYSKE